MLYLYSDGSGSNKEKIGSYAIITIESFKTRSTDDTCFLETDKTIFEKSEFFTETTTNRMEMQGVLECIKYLNSIEYSDDVEIISDSQYVIYSITKKWSKTKNIDLWKLLKNEHAIFKSRGGNIAYRWIRGHDLKLKRNLDQRDSYYNDIVDKLASETMANNRKKKNEQYN